MLTHDSGLPRRAVLRMAAALPAALLGEEAAHPTYLLTYDHGGLVLWGIDHFTEEFDEAKAWLDRYPGFKIGLENEAYTYDFLAERKPELLAEIRSCLTRYKGRFGIGTCTYGQPLSTFINEESNIRQIAYALEADRKHLGTAPEVYLMSEHAMHSQIPQIVRGFGFLAAIMRTHFMMYGYNPTFDTGFGWWVGLDGSRVPAVPTYVGQGAEFGRTTVDNWILTRCPGPECRGSLSEFRERFRHIRPLLASRADDTSLRREDLVKQTHDDPAYRWTLLEDIVRSFPAPRDEMKTAPNDFAVRMPWGYCGNEIWNTSRAAEVAVLTAERVAAVDALTGGTAKHEQAIDTAWKNLLVGQHHDVQICGLLPDARKYLGASLAASRPVLEQSMRAIAARMAGGKAGQITVFNPQSWTRREWVEARLAIPRGSGKSIEVHRDGKPVPSVLLSALRSSGDTIQEAHLAILAEVPGLAAASYAVVPAGELGAQQAAAAPSGNIETSTWTLRLSDKGGIESLVSKASGRKLLRSGPWFAGTIEGQPRSSEGTWRRLVSPADAPWILAREDGAIGGIPYRLWMKAWTDSPRLDFRVRFEFEGQRIGVLSSNKRDSRSPFLHEEKLRFRLHPEVAGSATGIRDLPFAIAPTADAYVQGNYWTAVSDEKAGVAFLNRGAMGAVREKDGGFSLPLAYAMYYIWGTRMLTGEYEYEWSVLPFEGEWQSADLHRRALEYNYPLTAVAGESGDGRLGAVARPVAAEGDGVLASALYSRGGAAWLRCYEYRGARAELALPSGRWTETDLAGNVRGRAGRTAAFSPWQIRTFRREL